MKKLLAGITLALAFSAAHADDQSDWLKSRQTQFAQWQATHPGTDTAIADLKAKTAALVAAAGKPTTDIHAPPVIRRVPGAITEIWDDAVATPMVVIPAGSYTMGSPPTEELRHPDEEQHRVTIDYAFALGKYPVTVNEYAVFAADTKRPATPCYAMVEQGKPWQTAPDRTWRNPGFAQTGNDPVVCVTWYDAQAYVQWLSKKTGKTYRLPSESEWQYAARGGTTTTYYWGDKPSHDYMNYGADDGDFCGVLARPGMPCIRNGVTAGRDKWVYTSPVGSFPPNPFGLYDMAGNAWQMTQDCYSPTFAAPTDGSPLTCERYSTLGGGWLFGPGASRPAYRGKDLPNDPLYGDGFRVARTL